MKAPRGMTASQHALWRMQGRIRSRLHQIQITQAELSQITRLSKSYVSAILSPTAVSKPHTRGPGLNTIILLAWALKCAPGWLAFGEGEGP